MAENPTGHELTAAILGVASVLRDRRPLPALIAGEVLASLLGHEAKNWSAHVLIALEEHGLAVARDGGWYRGPEWAKYAIIHGWHAEQKGTSA